MRRSCERTLVRDWLIAQILRLGGRVLQSHILLLKLFNGVLVTFAGPFCKGVGDFEKLEIYGGVHCMTYEISVSEVS